MIRECPSCGADMTWCECRRCHGMGEITDDDPINGPEYIPCPDCRGIGEVLDCEFCDEDY